MSDSDVSIHDLPNGNAALVRATSQKATRFDLPMERNAFLLLVVDYLGDKSTPRRKGVVRIGPAGDDRAVIENLLAAKHSSFDVSILELQRLLSWLG